MVFKLSVAKKSLIKEHTKRKMTLKFVLQSVNNHIVAILLPFAEIQATNIHNFFEKLCLARNKLRTDCPWQVKFILLLGK